MAITFPSSPSTGQVFTAGNRSWTWDGSSWKGGVASTGDASTLDGLDSTDFIRSNQSDVALTGGLSLGSRMSVGLTSAESLPYYSNKLVLEVSSQDGITIAANDTSATNYLMFADSTSGDARYRGYIEYNHNTENLAIAQAAIHRLNFSNTEAVFNEAGNSYDFRVESDTVTHALYVKGSDGNVGIGTNSPSVKFEVKADSNSTTDYPISISNSAGSLTSGYGAYGIAMPAGSEYTMDINGDLILDVGGNVLVGTTTNSYTRAKLTVFGAPGAPATSGTSTTNVGLRLATTTGNSQAMDFGIYNAGQYGGWIQASNSGNVSTTSPIAINPNGGNVGIGTSNPSEKLHIKNSTGSYIKHEGPSSGDYATGYQIFEGSTTSAAFYTNPTHDLTILSKDGMTFRLDNANRIKFTSTGNVGIGNTPADKLDVQGADNGITVRAITANRPVIKLVNGTTNMLQFSANGTYGAIGDGTDANRYMTFRDGYVTQPSQPSFDANSPNKTTAGNNIVYGSTRHNQGGHYSTSNGKFTAPIAGVYLFQYSVLLGNPMTGSYVRTLFRVNGTVSTGYGDTLNSKGNQTDYMSTNGALIIKLNANDYVNIYNEGQIVTYGANYGQFGGHLLG